MPSIGNAMMVFLGRILVNHDGSDMSTICASNTDGSFDDSRLMEEALRRARASRFDAALESDLIERVIVAELSRGTRNLHGLMRAVSQHSAAK